MSAYAPELGQLAYGHAWGRFAVPDYAEALLSDALRRIALDHDAAFDPWDWSLGDDGEPNAPGLVLRRFWWGDDDAPEAALPNLEFGDLKLWFYKYWGRGMSCNVQWSPRQWVTCWRALVAAIEASDE